MSTFMNHLKFNTEGLIPAIIQDKQSGRVLTLSYMNEAAIEKSFNEGRVYVYRRSLGKLMLKGEKSGHTQQIYSVAVDCEGKSLLIKVEQKVAACHYGYFTCYFKIIDKDGKSRTIEKKVFDPDSVYRSRDKKA